MLRSAWQLYKSWLQKRPLLTNTITTSFVIMIGDSIAQSIEHSRTYPSVSFHHHHQRQHPPFLSASSNTNSEQISDTSQNTIASPAISPSSPSSTESESYSLDLYRSASMFGWGSLVAVQMHYWYRFLDRILPGNNLPTVFKKITINQCSFTIWLNAAFFMYVILLETGIRTKEQRRLFIIESKIRFEKDLLATTLRAAAFWGTVHFFNFSYISPQFRVLYLSLCGVVWGAYVSIIGHKEIKEEFIHQQMKEKSLLPVQVASVSSSS